MDILEARDELVCKQQHSLQGEFPAAVGEKVLQAWSQEFKCHHSEFAVGAVPVNLRDAIAPTELFIDLNLIFEL